jgi:hypothetical protein
VKCKTDACLNEGRKRTGLCKYCYGREWRLRNKERTRETCRAWEQENASARNEAKRAWRQANPDKQRAKSQRQRSKPGYKESAAVRNRRWGMSVRGWSEELTNKAWSDQNGACAICTVQMNKSKNTGIPGCHRDHTDTPQGPAPRALLCHPCNVCLGYYEKRQRAAGLRVEPYERYLEKYGGSRGDI